MPREHRPAEQGARARRARRVAHAAPGARRDGRGGRMSTLERKPKWAWSSADDPHPDDPTCDRCDAFARWSIARHENEFDPMGGLRFTVRWFACGTHINAVLTEED